MAPPDKSTIKTRANSRDESELSMAFSDKFDQLFREMREFREETKEMGVSINCTHEKIDELRNMFQSQRADIDQCMEDIDCVKRENVVLKSDLCSVRQELCSLQQYTRKNCVDIQGVPEERQENIFDTVQKVARVLHFELTAGMVDAVHRLSGGKGSRPRGIILKFVRRQDCDELLRLAKVKRGFSASELGVISDNQVFVNPSLCKSNRELLFLAKEAVRRGDVKFAWYQNGKILVRKKMDGPAIHISSRDQLRSFNNQNSGANDDRMGASGKQQRESVKRSRMDQGLSTPTPPQPEPAASS